MSRLRVLGCVLVCALADIAFAQSGDIVIYGANSNRQIYSINLTQGTVLQVGTLTVGTQAMDQDPLTGRVYYFERRETGDEFLYWNPETRTNTRVRRYSPAPGLYAKRLAFAPNGTLYLMDGADNLWIINKQNGDLTKLGQVVGLVTGPELGTGDIAFGPDGTMYLNTYRNVYTVDIASLVATPLHVNLLGFDNISTGLAYCADALYASYIDNAASVLRIARIEVATGQLTNIWSGAVLLNDLTSCPAGGPPPPPIAPANLTAATTSTGIRLTWQHPSTDENGFRVERRTAETEFAQIASPAAGATSFTDTGLINFTEYTYRVRAFNTGGHSDYSNQASATAPGPNQAPTANIVTPADGAIVPFGSTLFYSGTGTDPEDGQLPASAFVWDGAPVGGAFIRIATGVSSGSLPATGRGTFIIRLTVTDSGGLTGQHQITVVVP